MKSTGVTFLGLLALIFIGLKLADIGMVASWSWWAVLAPLWVPWAVVVVFFVVVFAGAAIERVWRR